MLSVILPTFNESQIIKKTIFDIQQELNLLDIQYEIIVVDDNSPDKTWQIVKNLNEKDQRIQLLRRYKNKGLTASILDGFEIATGDYFLVMDADGQHDEKKISLMLKEIQNNDLVIGSRYIKGGSVGNWNFFRLFLSRIATYLSYPLISKKKITDPMAGFFLIKKSLYEKNKRKLKQNKGFKILLDILFLLDNKVKIKEIPYKFKTRKVGESKLNFNVKILYLKIIFKQYLKVYDTLIKFLIVGFIGIIVNLTLLFFFIEFLKFNELIASFLAIEFSIINNFLLHNYWTFSLRELKSFILIRFFKFNLISFLSMIVNLSVFFVFFKMGIWYIFAQFIGIVCAFFINFIVNTKWVFQK
jgi:dolichol-phosphate mannosyltransferase